MAETFSGIEDVNHVHQFYALSILYKVLEICTCLCLNVHQLLATPPVGFANALIQTSQ